MDSGCNETLYEQIKLSGTQIYKLRKSLFQGEEHSIIRNGRLVHKLEICHDEVYSEDEKSDMEEDRIGDSEGEESKMDQDKDIYDEEYQERYREMCSNDAQLTENELKQLLFSCPNLKVFDTTNSRYSRFYLEYMQTIDSFQKLLDMTR